MRNLRHFLLLVLLIPGLGIKAVAGDSPAATVSAFHDQLLAILQLPDYDRRYNIMAPAIEAYFATDTISRISLGRRAWSGMDQASRDDFESSLHRLIASTYASRFKTFNNQAFEVLASEPISDNRMRVRSRLVTSKETVSLDYQLQERNGNWRIYDVAANGVSDLSLKRSNYAALYRDGGLVAVQKDIQQEIEENEIVTE